MDTKTTFKIRANGKSVQDGVEKSKGNTWNKKSDVMNIIMQDAVTIESCDDELIERVKIAGDYEKRECGIELSSLEVNDSGDWECEVMNSNAEICFKLEKSFKT